MALVGTKGPFVAAVVAVGFAAETNHPTLPTMWTATVKEDEVGVVHESEHFVSRPEEQNPSAKWTNYTDGSCQRLIREGNNVDSKRYLLGCDAVQCCVEDGDGPYEYQIPNVHPALLAPVKSLGVETITLFDQSKVEADHWQWRFMVAQYNVYTTTATDGSVILHRWLAGVENQSFPTDYIDYKAVPADQEAAFLATFAVPEICSGAPTCANLHKESKLSDKSMKFLRSGKKSQRPPLVVV